MRYLVVVCSVVLVAAKLPAQTSLCRCTIDDATQDSQQPLAPIARTQEGDFDISHYRVKEGDEIPFKDRGVYSVRSIKKDRIVLRHTSKLRRIVLGDWSVLAGETRIGNHNRMEVSEIDPNCGTAQVSIKYKVRYHFWDINF